MHAVADPDGDPDDDSVPAPNGQMCPDHKDPADDWHADDVTTSSSG